MGYSKSKATLDARLPLLQELQEGRACHWTTDNAHKLAYYLREALFIAALYKDQYPELAAAHSKFRIEVVSPTIVQARLAPTTTEAQVLTGAVPVSGLELSPTPTFAAPQSGLQVIDYMKATQPSNEKYHWPQSFLNEDDLVEIWMWCISQTPQWLMFEADGSLTIQRKTRDLTPYAWTPEDIGREISDEARSLLANEGEEGSLGEVPEEDLGKLRPVPGRRSLGAGNPDREVDSETGRKAGGAGSFYRDSRREEVRGVEDESLRGSVDEGLEEPID